MRASSTLFVALSLASTAALAQSQLQPSDAGRQTPSLRTEQQQDQSQTQQGSSSLQQGQQSDQQQNLQQGQQSSGASESGTTQSSGDQSQSTGSSMDNSSNMQSSGTSSSTGSQAGGEGQLITSEIAHSKVAEVKTPSMIEKKTENGVSYVCGGIGDDEKSQMKQIAQSHDLNLTFADRKGAYVSDVNVTIADAKGNQVLQANCVGPHMALNLPKSGTYRIHAEASGYKLDRTVRVNTKTHTAAVFSWPVKQVNEQATASSGQQMNQSTGSSGNAGASSTQQPQNSGSSSSSGSSQDAGSSSSGSVSQPQNSGSTSDSAPGSSHQNKPD